MSEDRWVEEVPTTEARADQLTRMRGGLVTMIRSLAPKIARTAIDVQVGHMNGVPTIRIELPVQFQSDDLETGLTGLVGSSELYSGLQMLFIYSKHVVSRRALMAFARRLNLALGHVLSDDDESDEAAGEDEAAD